MTVRGMALARLLVTCSCFVHDDPAHRPMNAFSRLPPPDSGPEAGAARRERHLAALKRMTDMLLLVAEGTAEQALAEQAEARERREAIAEADRQGIEPPAARNAREVGCYTFTAVTPSFGIEQIGPPNGSSALVLARLATAVKAMIELERRVAAEPVARVEAAVAAAERQVEQVVALAGLATVAANPPPGPLPKWEGEKGSGPALGRAEEKRSRRPAPW